MYMEKCKPIQSGVGHSRSEGSLALLKDLSAVHVVTGSVLQE